jgi:hypothetical protein
MAVSREAPAVPAPLEQYAHTFDDLFHTHIQRRRFRAYLAGVLLPRDRNKTLNALTRGRADHAGADRPGAAAAVLSRGGRLGCGGADQPSHRGAAGGSLHHAARRGSAGDR